METGVCIDCFQWRDVIADIQQLHLSFNGWLASSVSVTAREDRQCPVQIRPCGALGQLYRLEQLPGGRYRMQVGWIKTGLRKSEISKKKKKKVTPKKNN